MVAPAESAVLAGLDGSLVRALQLDPRASYAHLGEVLGVSEQTVARRYARLRREGLVRVVGVVNPTALGQASWMVRLRCRPDGTARVAEALAQRDDVAWVTINSGGSEVQFSLRSRSERESEDLLVHRLPKTAPVLDIAASMIMRRFGGNDWPGLRDALTPAQADALRGTPKRLVAPGESIRLEPGDRDLLDLLVRDGRAGYAELARAAGASAGRVMRRVEALREAGALYFDVDLAEAAIGPAASASLWLQVPPARLEPVGLAIAGHDEALFVAAISGDDNLVVELAATSMNGLHEYLTTRLAAVEGVARYKITPTQRHVKQAGAITIGDRFSPSSSRPARSGAAPV
jgi:DNA-binding Lrp family transcriptional regulator